MTPSVSVGTSRNKAEIRSWTDKKQLRKQRERAIIGAVLPLSAARKSDVPALLCHQSRRKEKGISPVPRVSNITRTETPHGSRRCKDI